MGPMPRNPTSPQDRKSGDAPALFGGIMSGTSLDGVDVVLLQLEGSEPSALEWRLVAFDEVSYPPDRRALLRDAIGCGRARDLAHLHRELGRGFADAFEQLLDREGIQASEVTAVGSHGQTVWHEPPDADGPGVTLQLGDPTILAERLGVGVVSDFRSRDMAAGGQGAPLVPWADWVLLRRRGIGRALQNLGGMGNVTFLPADGRLDGVLGFDTGPGVALIDGAALRASDGREPWDRDGIRAQRGTVREPLLADWMGDAFFDQPPPRSTGRERFGEARLDQIVESVRPTDASDWDDLIATLTEWTARSVAAAYERYLPAEGMDEAVLTGGGARNPALVDALTRRLRPLPVLTGEHALGIDPDAREAAAFALFAWAHLHGVPANVPAVTGASGPRLLGSLTPPGDTSVAMSAQGPEPQGPEPRAPGEVR